MVKTAKVFSYIFHPVLIPLLGLLIIFNSGIPEVNLYWQYKKYVYLSFALFSLILPATVIPVFYYTKLTSDFQVSKRNERSLPLAIVSLFLIILHVFISRMLPIDLLLTYTFILAVISLLQLFVNIFYKLSLHLTALGSLTALIIGLTLVYNVFPFFWLALAVMITGIATSSRLLLKAHTAGQLITGFSLGFVITLVTLFIRL